MPLPKEIDDCLRTMSKDLVIDTEDAKGANGYVFMGTHKILDRRIALKFYSYDEDKHDEVRTLAGIKTPHVLTIYDAQTIGNGWAYFLTPESTLGDLDDYISGERTSLQASTRIVKGILVGLRAMHGSEIVHRDIKPANILLDQGCEPVIADFGSVKKIPVGQRSVSSSGHAALYRPPESWTEGTYTYASDIFQVGVVLYQLLGGYLPYDYDLWLNRKEKREYEVIHDPFEQAKFVDGVIAKKCTTGKLIDLNTIEPFVPRKLRSILRRATAINPGDRFQSCAEFYLALHNMGPVPDWVSAGAVLSLNLPSSSYRIVGSGTVFTCEKRSGSGRWYTKQSFGRGKRTDITHLLMKHLGMQ